MSSNTDIAISVRGLSKKYSIAHQGPKATTAAEALTSRFKNPMQKIGREEFWALRDVSFEVHRGDVIGIIGRNGAGKSTLLKVLSRITEPTSGEAILHGRVGSLLEVGTGFHAELTGRENIYLNGAILGMSRAEITRQFDAIVDFSGTEKFLDTPVKRYSSGMYVRLAFAVAAHLNPEILIVDEVLAVGDAEFQKKCIGKMQDVARGGRTILFVSHNMAAVNKLCNRGVLIQRGQVQLVDSIEHVVDAYLTAGNQADGERSWTNDEQLPGTDQLRLRRVRVLDEQKRVTGLVDVRQSTNIEIEYTVAENVPAFRVAFRLIDSEGTIAFTASDMALEEWRGRPRPAGTYRSICQIPSHLLNEGRYSLTITADVPAQAILLFEENAVAFAVEQTSDASGGIPERWPGVLRPRLAWQVESVRTTS